MKYYIRKTFELRVIKVYNGCIVNAIKIKPFGKRSKDERIYFTY